MMSLFALSFPWTLAIAGPVIVTTSHNSLPFVFARASGFTDKNVFRAYSMKLTVTIISFTALILASCGKAPLNVSDMRDDIQQYLQEDLPHDGQDPETRAIDLSEGYTAALLLAVAQNERYRSAIAIEREAVGQIGVSRAIRRLQISGGANLGAVREIGDTTSTSSGIAGGLNLSQLVYDGGASESAVNRATALALSAQAGRMMEANEITLGAASAWVNTWQYSERLRLMHHRTSEMALLVDQIERMASNGMLDRASLESARRQIVEIELEQVRLQAGLAEAHVLFRRFFAVSPAEVSPPQDLISAQETRSLAQNWRDAPSLQRMAAEMLVAQATVGEAEAAFRPRARVQGGARSPLESGESTDLTLGISLDYVIGDGGRRQSQLEAAQARYDAAKAQLSDAQTSLQADLQATLGRLDAMERSLPLLQEKLRLSQSEAETARSQLLTGQSNLRQLVEAEIGMYRTQDQQIAMQAELQILLLTIAARTGALSGLVGLEE